MGTQCWLITLFWQIFLAYRLIYCSWRFWFILNCRFDPGSSRNSLLGLLKISSCKLIATFLRLHLDLLIGGFGWYFGPTANSPLLARTFAFIFETSSNSTSLLLLLFSHKFFSSLNYSKVWTDSFGLGAFPFLMTNRLLSFSRYSLSLVSISSTSPNKCRLLSFKLIIGRVNLADTTRLLECLWRILSILVDLLLSRLWRKSSCMNSS